MPRETVSLVQEAAQAFAGVLYPWHCSPFVQRGTEASAQIHQAHYLGKRQFPRPVLVLCAVAMLVLGEFQPAVASAIPEPPVVLYGEVRNVVNGWNVRLTSGTLVWTLVPSDAGSSLVVTQALNNINDQFSFLIFLPCESLAAGLTASTNALRLSSPPVSYSLANVTLDGQPAYLQLPSQGDLVMTATNRGLIRRVDLTLQWEQRDTDGDGIPDGWETLFGFNPNVGSDAGLDADGDGLNNWQEYVAGTNPTNAQSAFAFIRILPDPRGGVSVEWSSASNRLYVVQRSANLLSGFVDIRTDVPATPPVNSYWDATAAGGGPFFYRLRIQQDPLPTFDGDGNGLPDEWERLHFGSVRINSSADPDGDGVSNWAEYVAGTNPNDASSVLKFVNIRPGPGAGVYVEWSSVVNKTYTILWSADPSTGYDVLASGVLATPPVNTFFDPDLYPAGFYRVLIEP